jgi:uncharacterized lipoprotein YbaY/uncharacterized lipoprotein NlpE involved in copper resistance
MKIAGILGLLSVVAGIAGCAATPAAAPSAAVTGTASYLERIAMPPGAVFEATLEDVSRMDVPADVISSVRQDQAGNPPYEFVLAYDPARIVPSRRYAVRARISLAGRLLYTSDQAYPVITNGHPAKVEILLKRVAGAAGRAQGGKPGDLLATLPATYTGVLPCADCEGIEHHLALFPDGSYALRTRYLGRPDAGLSDDIGTWALASDGITLGLKGGREAPVFFSIEDRDTFRKLDLTGRRIESDLNYDLKRTTGFSPIEPSLAMQGMFTYMADAATFAECTTGWKLPVAMEGAYIELERAYLAARGEPARPAMALVEGRIAMRPPMEGPGPVATLVVDRFLRLAPGEQCAPRFQTARLEDTRWKLVALGETAVVTGTGSPEPHVVLQAAVRRLAGSDGCNRLVAGYTLESDRIHFTQAASTMMACAEGMETAQRFAAAIAAASRWRVLGQQLELYDSEDRLLARFEARPAP